MVPEAAPVVRDGGHRPDASARVEALAASERREQLSIRRDFIISALLAVPLLVLAMSHGAIPGSDGIRSGERADG